MAAQATPKAAKAKLFKDDVVSFRSKPEEYAVVVRCWHDGFEDMPMPETGDPLDRNLVKGEYGVSSFGGHDRWILPEEEFVLQDRVFHPGDICKRSLLDITSGVVISCDGEIRIVHALSQDNIGWVPMKEVQSDVEIILGDYVISDDWIGTVQDIFEEVTVSDASGRLSRIAEIGAHFVVGEKTTDVLAPNFFASLLSSQTEQTVIHVKPTVVAVSWMAINQCLPPSECDKPRPQRYWSGEELHQLQRVVSPNDFPGRIGERVRFKTPESASRYGEKSVNCGGVVVTTMVVRESKMRVKVLWQDGSITEQTSTQLVPHNNLDEYDCWPGDHVVFKGEDTPRAAVIQKTLPAQRTATVLFEDDKSIAVVSSLEIDPQGPLPSSYGVRQGDMVLINRDTNGETPPIVPRLGEIEAWVRDAGHSKDEWRKEMQKIGTNLSRKTNSGDGKFGRASSVQWVGEVTGMRLDGLTEVTVPAGLVLIQPLEKMSLLVDDFEAYEVGWEEGGSDDDMDGSSAGSAVSWETVEEDWAADDEPDMPVLEDIDMEEVDALFDEAAATVNGADTLVPPRPDSGTLSPSPVPSVVSPPPPLLEETPPEDDPNWERFVIQETTPPDHAFASRISGQPGKAFMSRLQKEFKVLQSSLPDTILVRAYEDRTDVLRCLILGPENTPYEDAPFVIDWYLDPTFPQTPPLAHFHSWTNGNGRVNPNLYEEGKVCLSILNTWQGDRMESWSAARSSLLQAFVSIQGLVLVKEPWYCEPAFEKLRGTDEGAVSSRLYSEKAYVLSRNFVRQALETPVGGLEHEIAWLYYERGMLAKVVQDASELIAKSESDQPEESVSDRAVPRLTQGGILPLRRTLRKLQGLLNAAPATPISRAAVEGRDMDANP